MKTMLALFFILASPQIFSTEVSLQVNGISYHFLKCTGVDRCNGYNSGASIQIRDKTMILEAGEYFNSYFKESNYIAIGQSIKHKRIRYGYKLGIVDGYDIAPIIPMIAATLSVGYFNFMVTPRLTIAANVTIAKFDF